jgi:hypothetical protein
MKDDRFYVRLTTDEQIAQFVLEWQRNNLLNMKKESEASGLSVKEMMVAKGTWGSFVEACLEENDDPEAAAAELDEMVRNVE